MTAVATWNVHNINVSTLVFCRVRLAGVVQIPPGGFAVDFRVIAQTRLVGRAPVGGRSEVGRR